MVTPSEIQLKFLRTKQSFGASKQFTQFSFLDFSLNLSKMKKKSQLTTPSKKQHKNKTLQDTETDGACQHLLQQEKKEFIMEALKQV